MKPFSKHPKEFLSQQFSSIQWQFFSKLKKNSFIVGAMKVTPALSLIDREIGMDHQLESIDILDDLGQLTNVPPKYQVIDDLLFVSR